MLWTWNFEVWSLKFEVTKLSHLFPSDAHWGLVFIAKSLGLTFAYKEKEEAKKIQVLESSIRVNADDCKVGYTHTLYLCLPGKFETRGAPRPLLLLEVRS